MSLTAFPLVILPRIIPIFEENQRISLMEPRRILIVVVLAIFSCLTVHAQTGHIQLSLSTNFGPNNEYKPENVGYSPNLDVKAAYLFHLGSRVQLGAGAGVGFSTFVHYETEKVVAGGDPSYQIMTTTSPSVPLFAVAKVKILDRPSTPFLKVEGGHRLAWAKDLNKGTFNPYLFNVIPSVGYEFEIGKNILGIEAGAEYMSFKEEHEVADPDNTWTGGKLLISADKFNGVYLAVSFSF